MQFTEILATLPAIDHIAALELSNNAGLVARLENKPGTAGSVRVYHALTQEFGKIHAAAATKGLALYAEHTADAKTFPGKHPNIDRLLALSTSTSANADSQSLTVRLITR
ncbi:DUF2322 family protein [Undibacterium oligocarboniphilum]|uniref:DUF2322 family protein n=1 Tax=Undibacterium oligocarboniphilum TaxID=666702 RepID=A0A850QQH8_9BURK|nr:DUF2322 family protein [Undibacterium oligocarboniphilum]MBC3870555.1 DUF2322 family protein [Undibacterium oligocarboniphilum]NVO78644.1 DUF2322 family protein [Undibacterium oligocarboniphilum]